MVKCNWIYSSRETKHVEIIGIHVIPEFGMLSVAILGIAFVGIIYLARLNSKLSLPF